MRFAVDTGGTFTDLVVEDDEGACHLFKARTTPADPIDGVLDALLNAADKFGISRRELLARGRILVHGTTHALNAIITGRVARTAFITTKGHGDILVLREGGRSDPFNFSKPFPQPYIPRSLTFEVPERIKSDGGVLTPLDESAVLAVIQQLKKMSVEAAAVCFLWSIVNPIHEKQVGALLEEYLPGLPFTLSHRLNPAIREFRRASSTAIDASLKPMMGKYMRSLETRLLDAGFSGRTLVVTSQAGVIDAGDAADAPIHILNSGPSMAPIAGRYFASLEAADQDVIVADTGGTTYDVSIVRNGKIPTTRETWIGQPHSGIMIGFPWVDVKSVGAGGGSIAWIDSGGLLRVGPKSAGAVPGPVSYGLGGTEPTITDASVVLGHVDPDYFLGGLMKLDRDLAANAIGEKIAGSLGLGLAAAADAIITIATENMVQAIVDITVKQGIDPREAVLVGGGGAAGLNSIRIARRLGCRTVIVPEVGAALSSAGALMSDLKAEYHAVHFASTADFDFHGVAKTLDGLRRRCDAFAEGPGSGASETQIVLSADARYSTQIWEIEIPLKAGGLDSPDRIRSFVADFHSAHEKLFAFCDPVSPIEIIGWSAQVSCRFGEGSALRLAEQSAMQGQTCRRVYFAATGWCDVPVRRFAMLDAAESIPGPAIVESPFTTIVVDPGARATRGASGSLVIEVGA